RCGAPFDCASGVCESETCAAPSCGDGVRNGDETDVDCGGACEPCLDGGHAGGASCATSTAPGTRGVPLALLVLVALALIVRSSRSRRGSARADERLDLAPEHRLGSRRGRAARRCTSVNAWARHPLSSTPSPCSCVGGARDDPGAARR